jgi:SAM-dependent methyltransferase
MSIRVVRFAELAPDIVSTLETQLAEYYRIPPEVYYQIADQAAQQYTPSLQPFHCDLVTRVEPGMSLLEVGCGSAHLCPLVEAAGGSYTGMDYSDELLKNNRQRFLRARFLPIGAKLTEEFDIVASLYTIEHVVDPSFYLENLCSFCKPGGLIAIICPDFVDGEGLPPSFFYGKTPRRFREKIRSLAFGDAFLHLVDLWFASRWKSRARAAAPGAFWINLKPRILHGAEYSIDADAVHLARLKDLVWSLERRGAIIETTSQTLPDIDRAILRYNCYVLARKLIG